MLTMLSVTNRSDLSLATTKIEGIKAILKYCGALINGFIYEYIYMHRHLFEEVKAIDIFIVSAY